MPDRTTAHPGNLHQRACPGIGPTKAGVGESQNGHGNTENHRRGMKQGTLTAALVFGLGGVVCASAWGVPYWKHLLAMRDRWDSQLYKHDDEIGYVPAPNRHTKITFPGVGTSLIATDQFGFRIPTTVSPVTSIKPNGILGAGCSFMFGLGVSAEETIPLLMGRSLGLPSYNLGVPGFSPVTSYLWLKRHIAVLKPAIVVYEFSNFHFDRARSFVPPSPERSPVVFQAFFAKIGKSLIIHPPLESNRVVFQCASASYRDVIQISGQQNSASSLSEPIPYPQYLELMAKDIVRRLHLKLYAFMHRRGPSDEALAREIVDNLVRLCKAHGATLVILSVPWNYGEVCSPALLEAVRAFSQDPNVIFLDSSRELSRIAKTRDEFMRLLSLGNQDSHPNAVRNQLLANMILRILDQRKDRSAHLSGLTQGL